MKHNSANDMIKWANDNAEYIRQQYEDFINKYGRDGINEHLNILQTDQDRLSYLLKLKLKYTSQYPPYNEQYDHPKLAYWKKTIPEYIDNLIETYEKLLKYTKTKSNPQKKIFVDLFDEKYHDKIDSFKGWLRKNEFINENNQLLDLPTNFARIYYLLKYKGIIKPNIKDSVGIKTYFSDFQCEVKEKINPDSKNKETTRKTVTNQNAKSDLIYYPDNSPINNEDIIKLFS
ncbi:MAG: hypothetical protein PHQ11_03915 [Paludibacter sp.]|nr:hypothetical protein [Paludibacter sp.]